MEEKIIMLVNNVVTSSKEFFELNFEDLPMDVMFILPRLGGTAVIRFTNNQMPSLTPETKDEWMEQFKIVAKVGRCCRIKDIGANLGINAGFHGVCKLFYNA